MITTDTTVYVRWYGKLLQGNVVNDHDLMGMVAVRIPLQGGHPVALYTPEHVYASAEEAQRTENTLQHQEPAATVPDSCPSGDPPTSSDHPRPLPTVSNPSDAWQAIQQFKQEHWDAEHNRIHIDALEEFYQLWRAAVAAKYGIAIEPCVSDDFPVGEKTISVDPGSPHGDHSSIYIVNTETGKILNEPPVEVERIPIVTKEHYRELKEKMMIKLTKKQMRSTGRIQFTDSIQTSLFD